MFRSARLVVAVRVLGLASILVAVPPASSVPDAQQSRPIQSGTRLYVDVDAPGPRDRSTWCRAYSSLQDALAVAQTGDTIHVAEGTYCPTDGAGHAKLDATATFQLISGVTVSGGFAGCGRSPWRPG